MKKDITFKTLEVIVVYDYIPEEPQEKYSGDLDGYPGSKAKVDVSSINLMISDVLTGQHLIPLTSFFEETGLIYQLEEQLLKEIQEEND